MVRKNLSTSIVKKFIPSRKSTSRKGDNGIVLVVGGSYIYHGAPILSSIAALRCGTDLVYTSVPKINVAPTRAISPNLIVIPLVDQKLTRGAVNKLVLQDPYQLLQNADYEVMHLQVCLQHHELIFDQLKE